MHDLAQLSGRGEESSLRPLDIVVVCLSVGVATGAIEIAFELIRDWDPRDGVGANLVWMTPLSAQLWFAGLAALLCLTRRWLRWTRSATFGLAIVVATTELLIGWPQLYRIAVGLLALGIGRQAAWLAQRRPAGTRRWLNWAAGMATTLVAIATSGVAGRAWWREERTAAGPLPAPASPNVLLVVLDAVRASELSVFGQSVRTTPGLERWAAQGVAFGRAFATAPWTLPSHGTMFTGQWSHRQSSSWRSPLDDTYPTVAEAFHDAGYLTAGFVGNLVFCSRKTGLSRGFVHYEDYPVNFGEFLLSSATTRWLLSHGSIRRMIGNHDILGRKRAADVTRSFLAWRNARAQPRRPFFAFLNLYDAHEPYLPPPELERTFAGAGAPRSLRFKYYRHDVVSSLRGGSPAAELERERVAYQASIASMDAAIDSLFGALARRGELDRTVVIVVGDHGEQLGEHRLIGHTNSLFSQVLHVPLIIRYPASVPAGLRLDDPVSLRDLAATMLDLAGVPGHQFPGTSLARWWNGSRREGNDRPLLATFRDYDGRLYRSAVADSYHYIDAPGVRHLFNIAADPLESVNLLDSREHEPVLEAIAAVLDSLVPVPR